MKFTLVQIAPVLREVDQLFQPWMSWFILLTLLLIAGVRIQYPQYLQLVRWSFSNYRIARQSFVEREFQIRQDWLLMFPVMVMGHSFFLYVLLASTNETTFEGGPRDFLRLVFIVVLVYLMKIIAIQLVSTLAKPVTALKIYQGNTVLLSEASSILLWLLALAGALSAGGPHNVLLWLGVGVMGFSYFLRLGRGIFAALEERISLQYIILYLCTLEILPLAVLIKAWLQVHSV